MASLCNYNRSVYPNYVSPMTIIEMRQEFCCALKRKLLADNIGVELTLEQQSAQAQTLEMANDLLEKGAMQLLRAEVANNIPVDETTADWWSAEKRDEYLAEIDAWIQFESELQQPKFSQE